MSPSEVEKSSNKVEPGTSSDPDPIYLTEAESPFPVLTQEFAPRPSAGGNDGDPGRLVAETISDVLGWRTRSQDADGFMAALAGSFGINRVEGHNEVVWTPRGYSAQADLGLVTGGQASLAARAQTVVRDSLALLDSLAPLRVDPDPQDVEAFRALVRHGLTEVLAELQSPVVRPERVDILFLQLTGGATMSTRPDNVDGYLGRLRELGGFTREFVNTVPEERVQTSFFTLADWVLSLEASWYQQKPEISLTDGSGGFLGTTLVRLSQELAVVAGQVEAVWAALDSVFITAAERQTTRLDPSSSLSLQGLLDWIHGLVVQEIPKMIQSGGKDAVEHAITPLLSKVERLLRDNLLLKLPTQAGVIQLSRGRDSAALPPGLNSVRVQLAVYELFTQVQQARQTARRVHRNFEVAVAKVQPFVVRQTGSFTLTVFGSGLRPDEHTAVLLSPMGQIVIAEPQDDTGKDNDTGVTSQLAFTFDPGRGEDGPWELAIVREGVDVSRRVTTTTDDDGHITRTPDWRFHANNVLDFTHVFVNRNSNNPTDAPKSPAGRPDQTGR